MQMLQNILIVDDEKFIRQGLKRMIEQSGCGSFCVALARNGQEALEYMEHAPVDMVFTDISMPLMNGIDFLRRLSAMKCRPVTIIISGYNDFSYAVEGLRNGVVDYLLKPIDDAQVRKLLEKYRDWGEAQREDGYARQLLVRDLRYAAVEAEFPPEQEQEMLVRIGASLGGRQPELFFMRIHSLFFQSTVEERLHREFGQQAIFVADVGKWTMIVSGAAPSFLTNSGETATFWVGAVRLKPGMRFCEACRQARNAAKRGFLTGRSFVWADEAAQAIVGKPCPLNAEECVYAIGMGRNEAVRGALERSWGEQARKALSAEMFEAQLKAFLSQVRKEYPQIYSRYALISQKLEDYMAFSGWQEFSREFLGYTYLIANAVREYGMGRYSQTLQNALQYIEEHFARDINLAMVANHVSANYSVLSREFKEQVGINFVNYLKQRRIEAAKGLLLTTRKSSGEIGREVGFVNERQYAKVFRDITGLTPTEFRRLHPGNADDA